MEFSLEHLALEPDKIENRIDRLGSSNRSSSVLDDLASQIEDLQNKLKLNYRKLLLFETENEKLIQEKNKLYFDVKNHQEKLTLLTERHSNLENYSNELELKYKSSSEKCLTYENLNQTQSVDLKRLSKFHLKIKDIIKPYIQTLKTQISDLEINLEKSKKMSSSFEQLNAENALQVTYLKQNLEQQKLNFESEKTNFIQSYEEQIHFLSKELLQLQQKNELLQSEVFKQKKMNENKNFIENELIRFKRISTEDQNEIGDLKLKVTHFENTIQKNHSENSSLKTELQILKSQNQNLTQNLEATRLQLNQKIEDVEKMHLRLKMLENLNSNLSLSFKAQNCAELPTTSKMSSEL